LKGSLDIWPIRGGLGKQPFGGLEQDRRGLSVHMFAPQGALLCARPTQGDSSCIHVRSWQARCSYPL
jgi:hypothetical protein